MHICPIPHAYLPKGTAITAHELICSSSPPIILGANHVLPVEVGGVLRDGPPKITVHDSWSQVQSEAD